jgi:catalase
VFLGSHPRALKFVTTPKPASASFANESYYAVNAFRFTNRDGARYQIHPVGGEVHLSDMEAAQRRANYLVEELGQRLARGPVEMRLVAELAKQGDPVNDPSITWPDDRTKLELGTIRAVKVAADSDAAQRKLIFDPVHIADGIELSDDPFPAVRSAVYSISYKRRNA